MGGRLRGAVAALPRVVPAGGRGGARLVRDERPHAAGAHARADAGVRAGRRARGRRRPRRADALALQAAALPGGVLAGRVDARGWARARAQLRLRPRPVRGADLVHPAARATGDRDERLPVGPARRHERRRPRGLAHVRRASGAWATGSASPSSCGTCWRPARRCRRRERRSRGCRISLGAQPHDGRSRRRRAHRLPVAPIASRSSGRSRPRRTIRASWSGPSRPRRRARSSASSASCGCSRTTAADVEAFADAFLRSPLFSTAYANGWGTLYTAVLPAARRRRRLPVADRTRGGSGSRPSPRASTSRCSPTPVGDGSAASGHAG